MQQKLVQHFLQQEAGAFGNNPANICWSSGRLEDVLEDEKLLR